MKKAFKFQLKKIIIIFIDKIIDYTILITFIPLKNKSFVIFDQKCYKENI